jgi:hypothetical protein
MLKRIAQTLLIVGICGLIVGSTLAQQPIAARHTDAAIAAKIKKALDEKTTMEFIESPLSDVADFLSQLHSIEVDINSRSLDDIGIGTDTPITIHLKGITLRSALRLMLRDLALTYTIRNGTLQITSLETAESQLVNRVYAVSDLLQDDPQTGGFDYDSLVEVIENAVQRETWDTVGGPCTVEGVLGNIVVSQTTQGHRDIDRFLSTYRLVIAELKKNDGKFPTAYASMNASAASAKIRAALDNEMNADFVETPLSDASDFFAQFSNIPITFDRRGLDEIGISPDTPITLNAKSGRFQDVLRRSLDPIGLVYIIRDETLQITTPEVAEAALGVHFYPIGDLSQAEGFEKGLQYDRIIDVITSSISPESWEDVGGPGTLDVLSPGILVISQLDEKHDQIADLLTTLRKQSVQPKSDPKAMVRRVYRLFAPAIVPTEARVPLDPEVANGLLLKLRILLPNQDWNAEGAAAEAVGSTLVIKANRQNHHEIKKLLVELGLFRFGMTPTVGAHGGGGGGMFDIPPVATK